MRNAQPPMEGKPRPTGVSLNATHREFDRPPERGGNDHIRRLLKSFGLRTSLIRLKVIDALLKAAHENRCLRAWCAQPVIGAGHSVVLSQRSRGIEAPVQRRGRDPQRR